MKKSTIYASVSVAAILVFAVTFGRSQSRLDKISDGQAFALPPGAALIAHEWGTFTSFQGADGKLRAWRPLETSKLPKFVYDIQHPGFDRASTSLDVVGKGDLTTLQRLETPVIYFYAAKPETVDVTVRFPKGTVTEWYPQVTQVGPATSPAPDATAKESLIHWSDVRVIPPAAVSLLNTAVQLPTDDSGSHYFAARKTDSDLLITKSDSSKSVPPSELEKFLFYRGVGNFTTPLLVTMPKSRTVTVANTGTDVLRDLFVLDIHGPSGAFVRIAELAPGASKSVSVDPSDMVPIDELANRISDEMAAALVQTGLFPREARAMVDTWRDSWFQEKGVRILYPLPRAWTDQTLDLTIVPAPDALVRTMVGRAEVLPPDVEVSLVEQFNLVKKGDQSATAQARQTLAGLGRFGFPAFTTILSEINVQPADGPALTALLPALVTAEISGAQ